MLTPRALQLVNSHRFSIDRHVAAAQVLLSEPPQLARRPLALARWRLLQMLREYHLFKRVEIFEPAMRSGLIAKAEDAQKMLVACEAGLAHFITYTRTWSSQDVVASWSSYTSDMQRVAKQLRGHVAREELLVGRLLAGSSRTRHLF